MTIAEVLAYVDGGEASEAVVRAALAVGRSFEAHVELLHVETAVEDAIPTVSDGLAGPAIAHVVDDLEQAAEARAKAAHDLFEKHCLSGDHTGPKGPSVLDEEDVAPYGRFTVTWRQLSGRAEFEVVRRGRLADLIVMAKASGGVGLTTELKAALFDSGRPVLLAPVEAGTAFGQKIAVAWDGSREAVRAASAALPFLTSAREILVLTTMDAGCDADPLDLEGYLARHGVAAVSRRLEHGSGSVAESLLETAGAAHCDLLVMGAYGRSRLRELVFGGTTESILKDTPMLVLLTH